MQKQNANGAKKEKISLAMIKKLAIVTIAVNLLLVIIVNQISSSFMETKEEYYLSEISDNISSTIAAILEEYTAVSSVVALNSDIIDLLADSDMENPMRSNILAPRIINNLMSIKTKLPEIVNIGVCDIEQNSYMLHDGVVSGSSFSFRDRVYFSVTQTKKSMITDPYIDDATGDLVVTMATPVLSSNGTALGAIFLDLSLDFVVDLVGEAGFGETGKSFISDTAGLLVACMDYEYIGTPYSNLGVSGAELTRELASPSDTLIELNTNGATSYGKVSYIDGTSWAIVTSMEVWEFEQDSVAMGTILIALQIASIVATLLFAAKVVQDSIKPIEYVRVALNELSQGNTNYKLEYQSNNELGALADDLRFTTNNLGDYIKEINRLLSHCGKGDFTVTSNMEFLGDFSDIQTSIRSFTTLISQALEEIKMTVDQVTSGSNYVANGSQDLAEGSSKQFDSIQILNGYIENITKHVEQNAQNAQEINNSAQVVTKELGNSNVKMSEMVKSMEEINEKSRGIEAIVKTIEDVAFQINILALNAAVEAARAGEAGKGFSVVAEEVRNLSHRTSEALQLTGSLIEETATAVAGGNKIAEETAKNLKSVTDDIYKFIDTLDEITKASQEQAEDINHIHSSVVEISNVMQTNSSISEESAATSEELSSQANAMKNTIEKFKTK